MENEEIFNGNNNVADLEEKDVKDNTVIMFISSRTEVAWNDLSAEDGKW